MAGFQYRITANYLNTKFYETDVHLINKSLSGLYIYFMHEVNACHHRGKQIWDDLQLSGVGVWMTDAGLAG